MTESGKQLSAGAILIAIVLALILATWVSRLFFVLPVGQIYENQDDASNVYLLIDFRDALESGHWSPQWSTYMHGGLGDALFSYYQPGFFYLAALLPHSLDPRHAIGVAVLLMIALGSFSMWYLVGSRFGPDSGFLAMTLLAFSTYAGTEIYVRGDCAELTAMMLLPLQLETFLAWRRSRHALPLAACTIISAAVVLSHAPIAVAIYLCLVLNIAVEEIALRRTFAAAFLDGIPLLLGGLLASFYWFPVVFEWPLVQSSAAFGGFYLYSRHFVGLRALLGRFSESPNVVPVALGPILLGAVAIAAFVLWFRRDRWTEDQRALIGMLICVTSLSGFLMVRFSSFVWRFSPTLQRLQFPWRMLAPLTVGLAGLAGIACVAAGRRRKIMVSVVIVLTFTIYPYRLPANILNFSVPAQAADLVHLNYAPDGANEWLPNGAHPSPPAPFPEILASMPNCNVSNFRRGQSQLTATVDMQPGCVVRLPHYFFPVGWRASIGGADVPIENDDGWMAVRLPNGGHGGLMLSFGLTPARRRGLIVSLVTAIFLVGFVAVDRWLKRD